MLANKALPFGYPFGSRKLQALFFYSLLYTKREEDSTHESPEP